VFIVLCYTYRVTCICEALLIVVRAVQLLEMFDVHKATPEVLST
jgi:hypothetical protein